MLKIRTDPNLRCTYAKPFQVIHDESGADIHTGFLQLKGKVIKVKGINADSFESKAEFTEVENSTCKSINVVGSVYIHDCPLPIGTVKATKNICLLRCAHITNIVAGGTVTVIRRSPSDCQDSKYGPIRAARVDYHYVEQSPTLSIGDFQVAGDLKLDERFKTLKIYGDCSRVPRVVFQGNLYPSTERMVIVMKGASFKGEVIGGQISRVT